MQKVYLIAVLIPYKINLLCQVEHLSPTSTGAHTLNTAVQSLCHMVNCYLPETAAVKEKIIN